MPCTKHCCALEVNHLIVVYTPVGWKRQSSSLEERGIDPSREARSLAAAANSLGGLFAAPVPKTDLVFVASSLEGLIFCSPRSWSPDDDSNRANHDGAVQPR